MPSTVLDTALACIRRRAEAGTSPTDRQLLDRFTGRGDEAAFTALVRRHGGRVLAACRRVLADPADVDDAFQATFLVLLDKARAIRWQPSLGGWLTAVAHRVSVRARDAARRRQRHENHAGTASAAVAPDPSWREACGILHEELDRLPDRFRLPLVLCYLESKSRDEAAAQLGWSAGSVKGRLERGRDKLRRRLERRGITLSAGLLAALAGEANATVVSTALIRSTVEAAGGGPSAAVATLIRGTGAVTHVKFAVVAVVLGLAAVGTGVGMWIGQTPVDKPPAPTTVTAPPVDSAETVTVHGRVLDPAGKPVPGARLFTYQMPAGTPPGTPPTNVHLDLAERTVTDADGRFRFVAPRLQIHPPGDSSYLMPVLAVADGFGVSLAKLARPDDDMTVGLEPDQPIVVRVLDSEGRPAARATVRVREMVRYRSGRLDRFLAGWQAGWRDALFADCDTGLDHPPDTVVRVTGPDHDGRFQITGVGAERRVILEIQGPGLAQGMPFVLTRAGIDPEPVNRAARERAHSLNPPPMLHGPTFDYVATPAKPLNGVVREAVGGRPVAGAQVISNFSYSHDASAITDAAGRFHLDGIPKAKEYFLFVRPPAGSPLIARSVRLPDTAGLEPLTADAKLARGVMVTGRVIDRATGHGTRASVSFYLLPDNPNAGKTEFNPEGKLQSEFSANADADGRFRLPVIPGPGVLTVQASGSESIDTEEVDPFLPAHPDERECTRSHLTTRGDRDFFVTAADGNNHPIHGHIIKWLDPAAGAEREPLELFVDRGRTATVRIEDPDGRPLNGAIVSGITATWPITYALPRAECTLYALDPGRPRTVIFYHPDKKLVGSLRIRGDETAPLTVRLLPASGVVTGRLLDADGRPVAGAGVSQYYPDDESARELFRYLASRGGPGIRTKTDADGRFRCEEVLPDLKLLLGFSKGTTILAASKSNQWFGPHHASAGKTLDLGDIRTRPWEP